ncbi:MAG: PDZ domain-containing protein, partial [Deltaproteobacteria bacterium]|nr:PDZ domain-containing protein [Deltaproteobacteria bacterium]
AVVIPDEHHLVTILGPGGVDVDGWLGAAFWERFAVGIDPLEGTEESPQVLYLWGDGAAPAAHAGRWDKVGVELAWRDGLAEVDSVYAGTDAEAQGIQRGDVLLSVDGTAVDALPLTEVRQLLRGAPGDTRTLSLAPPDGDPVTLPVLVEAILP